MKLTTFKTAWYDWCVGRALYWHSKGDTQGWIFWWAERNRYIWGLTSAEIRCYRKFKTSEYKRINLELLSTVNGRPGSVFIKLKTREVEDSVVE